MKNRNNLHTIQTDATTKSGFPLFSKDRFPRLFQDFSSDGLASVTERMLHVFYMTGKLYNCFPGCVVTLKVPPSGCLDMTQTLQYSKSQQWEAFPNTEFNSTNSILKLVTNKNSHIYITASLKLQTNRYHFSKHRTKGPHNTVTNSNTNIIK